MAKNKRNSRKKKNTRADKPVAEAAPDPVDQTQVDPVADTTPMVDSNTQSNPPQSTPQLAEANTPEDILGVPGAPGIPGANTPGAPGSGFYEYDAQTIDGHMITGAIEADDAEQATWRLQGLGLRLLKMQPRPHKTAPLTGIDFAAFNEQLAALTKANLPIERGLRLIANDMHKGKLATTINLVASELETGLSLPQAFDKHRKNFPPAYASLMDAGIQSGDLPSVLMNMSQHLEMVQRLKNALWRAIAYPIMVLAALAAVMLFLSIVIVPAFEPIFEDFGIRIPAVTAILINFSRSLPFLIPIVAAIAIGFPALWAAGQRLGALPTFLETFGLRIPVLGKALRQNITARWCDAVKIAIEAGRDLPASIQAAADTIGIKAVNEDSRGIIVAIETAKPLENIEGLRILPHTVPATIGLSAARGNLPQSLSYLTDMYRNQAQLSFDLFRAILPSFLMVIIAVLIGYTIVALFMPLTAILQSLS